VPDNKEYNRLRARARQNAWKMLEKKHPEQFAVLHDIARADLGLDPVKSISERVHGTRSMYNICTAGPDGGKCEPCTIANRDYQRGYMSLWRHGIPLKSEADAYWDD